MEAIHVPVQIDTLRVRMRHIRESRHLTLVEAASLSKGRISAIALGSYERGDRSVSAQQLITIAEIYQIPVTDLFAEPIAYMSENRVSFDIRKLLTTDDPAARKIAGVIRNVAKMRGDWNGEVLSLRSQDINSFMLFTGLDVGEINATLRMYGVARSK